MGKRVPTFEAVRDWLVEWADEHGADHGIDHRQIDYLRNLTDYGEARQYLWRTLEAGINRGLTGGYFDWARTASNYARGKYYADSYNVAVG